MTSINSSSNGNRQSIVNLFIIFILMTVILFFGMTLGVLIPKIDQAFENIRGDSDKTTANVYAAQLRQYIHDRELALTDIANSSLVTNTSILSDADNPAFRDYINHITLLGEDPELTILNIVGDVLYTESKTKQLQNHSFQWALPLLDTTKIELVDNDIKHSLISIDNSTAPQFLLAVPVLYGNRAQGVLIARITADPESLFTNDELGQYDAVSYEINGQRVASDTRDIRIIHNENIDISDYGLNFTYITDRLPVIEQQKALSQSFIITTLLGSVAICCILLFIGRRLIVRPFQELAASRQSIASAVEGISYIDIKGCYVTLNFSYANIAGYAPEELEGKPWITTVYPEDLPALERAYQTMIEDGKVVAEARGVKKDGSLFFKRITMISRYNEKGLFVGHDCFMQDISAQKTTEEKVRKQQQDLQLIFDNVPVHILYKDDKNRILRLNKKAAESMGGKPSDFEGKNCYDLFPDMAKKYHDDDLRVITSHKPELNLVEEYTPLNAPRGWVSTDKIPYTDPATNESFIFVCIQDITPIKNAEEAQSHLIEQLSHTNKELEEFAYIASHDLKSPLRGIEQLSGWINQDCQDFLPEQSKKHLSLMSNRVHRMGRMLDDLLTYSHVTRIDTSREEVDLHSILNDLADMHLSPFGFTHTLEVPEDTVLISRKPFEIIVRNLLDNAVKHHHKDTGDVLITYKAINNTQIFLISDDGPGIEPDLHDKAFKMFQTLKPRDKIEGSGMGLALIRKILSRYNGTIDIDSDGKNGTAFIIVWPNDLTEQET